MTLIIKWGKKSNQINFKIRLIRFGQNLTRWATQNVRVAMWISPSCKRDIKQDMREKIQPILFQSSNFCGVVSSAVVIWGITIGRVLLSIGGVLVKDVVVEGVWWITIWTVVCVGGVVRDEVKGDVESVVWVEVMWVVMRGVSIAIVFWLLFS